MLVRCAPKNSGVTLQGLELHRRWLDPLWQRNADDASSGSRTKYETHMASVLLILLDAEEGYSLDAEEGYSLDAEEGYSLDAEEGYSRRH
jgi:hypothetical protein